MLLWLFGLLLGLAELRMSFVNCERSMPMEVAAVACRRGIAKVASPTDFVAAPLEEFLVLVETFQKDIEKCGLSRCQHMAAIFVTCASCKCASA